MSTPFKARHGLIVEGPATLASTGNVLIGRTTSTVGQNVKLDVNGAINASAVLVNGAPLQTTSLTSNVVISVADNTNAALRITQTGTGPALVVEDSANPDATAFVVDANGDVKINSAGIGNTKFAVSDAAEGRTLIYAASPGSNWYFDFAGSGTSYLGSNTFIIRDGKATAEYMRIQSTGNLLINRTTSTVGQNVKLDVNGAINASAVLVNGAPLQTTSLTSNVVISVADNTNAALRITQTGTGEAFRVEDAANPDATPFTIDSNGLVRSGNRLRIVNEGNGIEFDTGANSVGYITNFLGNTLVLSPNSASLSTSVRLISTLNPNNPGDIQFWAADALRCVFSNTGNVLIGRTDSTVGLGVKLDVNGAINASAVIATDFNSTSDIKLKSNVHTLSNGLEIINNINPVSFNWKENDKRSYGVIAQEIENILPEIVTGTETKHVSYTQMIAILISAVKELNEEVKKLKNNANSL